MLEIMDMQFHLFDGNGGIKLKKPVANTPWAVIVQRSIEAVVKDDSDDVKNPRLRLIASSLFHALGNEDGSYDLQHRDGVVYRMHNHGPTFNPVVHHQHHRLRGPVLEHAKALIAAGLKVKDILTVLSKSEHVTVPPIAADTTNLMQKVQALELNGNTSIDA
jgi:hypothetical protein